MGADHASTVTRAFSRIHRMWRDSGLERDTVFAVAKSTLAACTSWGAAVDSPAFGPFSVLLFVHISVYQSITQCLRYFAAVVAGVLLQGVIGFLVAPSWLAFGMVAIALSRWKALRSQGPQVAAAASFAFSLSYAVPSVAGRLTQLAEIIEVVLMGGVIGVLVNLLVLPPLRYRSAEYGLQILAGAICALVADMAAASRTGDINETVAGQWRQRALQLHAIAGQARDAVPRRTKARITTPVIVGARPRLVFSGYSAVIAALTRVVHQLISVTRTMEYALDERWRQIDPQSLAHNGEFWNRSKRSPKGVATSMRTN